MCSLIVRSSVHLLSSISVSDDATSLNYQLVELNEQIIDMNNSVVLYIHTKFIYPAWPFTQRWSGPFNIEDRREPVHAACGACMNNLIKENYHGTAARKVTCSHFSVEAVPLYRDPSLRDRVATYRVVTERYGTTPCVEKEGRLSLSFP